MFPRQACLAHFSERSPSLSYMRLLSNKTQQFSKRWLSLTSCGFGGFWNTSGESQSWFPHREKVFGGVRYCKVTHYPLSSSPPSSSSLESKYVIKSPKTKVVLEGEGWTRATESRQEVNVSESGNLKTSENSSARLVCRGLDKWPLTWAVGVLKEGRSQRPFVSSISFPPSSSLFLFCCAVLFLLVLNVF